MQEVSHKNLNLKQKTAAIDTKTRHTKFQTCSLEKRSKKYHILFAIFVFAFCSVYHTQSIWSDPSYKKNSLIIYSGSGAFARHIESNYFKDHYLYYIKSPFLSAGIDYCFSETPNEFWGIGIYSSSLMGKKKHTEKSEEIKRFWSSSLIAIKLTHHSKFFVTKKLDLSSCYIAGVRIKDYHGINNAEAKAASANKNSIVFAGGIGVMGKYYLNDRTALYAEGTLGFRLDIFQIGISRKLTF